MTGRKNVSAAAAKHNVKQPVVPLSRVMTSSHPSWQFFILISITHNTRTPHSMQPSANNLNNLLCTSCPVNPVLLGRSCCHYLSSTRPTWPIRAWSAWRVGWSLLLDRVEEVTLAAQKKPSESRDWALSLVILLFLPSIISLYWRRCVWTQVPNWGLAEERYNC